MRKLISLILSVLMLLSLCACGSSGEKAAEPEAPKGLQAGFGREIVMPEDVTKVNLNGTDTAGRKSTGFLDYLKVTCIALKDEAKLF